jgi:cytochrome c
MNTMEITKLVGAFCGSLLVFLLIVLVSEAIYATESEKIAYLIETDGAEEGDEGHEAEEEAIDVAALVAEADTTKGEKTFKRCAACHKIDGANAVGPHLDGVVGREKGSVAGFKYSGAFDAIGGTWDEAALFDFLANPKGFAPGTSMSFAGLKKPDERAGLIAYLAGLSR